LCGVYNAFCDEEKDIEDENEERRRGREDLDRPGTPEPSSLGLDFRLSPTMSKTSFPLPSLPPLPPRLMNPCKALTLAAPFKAQYATTQGTIVVIVVHVVVVVVLHADVMVVVVQVLQATACRRLLRLLLHTCRLPRPPAPRVAPGAASILLKVWQLR
jgi:hypothetical protein